MAGPPFDRWHRELARLDALYRDRTLPAPLVEVQARPLLVEILETYAAGGQERGRLRSLVPRYEDFFRSTEPPEAQDPVATLRLHLLLFSLKDQYPDYREAFGAIDRLVVLSRRLGVSEEQLARLRREVAEVSNPEPRWPRWFPHSTRELLLQGTRDPGP
jgi:hypothetical protein